MKTKQPLDLSISIVSFNTKEKLHACLKSIYKYAKNVHYEVFVVDNASTDGSPEMVIEKFPQTNLIKNQQNCFFTKAHNQALRAARGKYVLILNSDTLMRAGTLTKVIKFLDTKPNIGALGIKQILLNGQLERTCQQFTTPLFEFFHSNILARFLPKPKFVKDNLYNHWDRTTSRYVDVVSDACLFAPRNVIQEVGYYDENLLLFFTENDLCLKIKSRDYHVYHFAQAAITHVGTQSLKLFEPSQTYRWYEHDLLVYYRKYFSFQWWYFLWMTTRLNHLYYAIKYPGR